jgi:hypothetical protein
MSYGQPNKMPKVVFASHDTILAPPTPAPREPKKGCEKPIAPIIFVERLDTLAEFVRISVLEEDSNFSSHNFTHLTNFVPSSPIDEPS